MTSEQERKIKAWLMKAEEMLRMHAERNFYGGIVFEISMQGGHLNTAHAGNRAAMSLKEGK